MTAEDEIARWRHAADYAEQEAARTRDASLRTQWLEVAASYQQLIRDAEDR